MRESSESTATFAFRPIPIRRSKWTHHFQVHSPKLGRRLSLYRRNAVEFWAMLEGHPDIIAFCELPGFIIVDGGARIADFVLRRIVGDEFIVLDGRSLTALEDTDQALLDPLPIVRISNVVLKAQQQQIDNWLQIVPYLTSNVRFLRPEFLSQIEDGLSLPKPLVAIDVEESNSVCISSTSFTLSCPNLQTELPLLQAKQFCQFASERRKPVNSHL